MNNFPIGGFLVGILLLSLILLNCSGPGIDRDLDRFSGMEGTIHIAGGTAHIPVMNDAAKAIMAAHPKIRIVVEGGGSGIGVQKAGTGLVDIGNTGRALTREEVEKYGLISHPFALDGIAVIVHPDNKIAGLTSQQVQAIFSGSIKKWKEVGGPDSAIHLYSRGEASGTREVFWTKLLNRASIARTAIIVSSNGAMKVAVAQDMDAIGYVGIGHVDQTVKSIKLDTIEATQENAMNGTYPVVRKLYMNTKGKPGRLVQAFIQYILSAEGIELIQKYGYLPLTE